MVVVDDELHRKTILDGLTQYAILQRSTEKGKDKEAGDVLDEFMREMHTYYCELFRHVDAKRYQKYKFHLLRVLDVVDSSHIPANSAFGITLIDAVFGDGANAVRFDLSSRSKIGREPDQRFAMYDQLRRHSDVTFKILAVSHQSYEPSDDPDKHLNISIPYRMYYNLHWKFDVRNALLTTTTLNYCACGPDDNGFMTRGTIHKITPTQLLEHWATSHNAHVFHTFFKFLYVGHAWRMFNGIVSMLKEI